MRSPLRGDPLLPWKVLAVLALAFTAAAHVVYQLPEQQGVDRDRRVTSGIDWILGIHRAKPHSDGPRVLAIGNSLLNSALPEELEMARLLGAALERDGASSAVRFQRISFGAMALRHLETRMGEILALAPDLLVIEADTLFEWPRLEWFFDNRSKRAARWAEVTRHHLLLCLHPEARSRWSPLFVTGSGAAREHSDLPFAAQPAAGRAAPVHLRSHWMQRFARPDDRSYLAAKQLIERAKAAAIRVVILEIPMGQKVHEIAGDFFAKRRRLVEQLGVDAVIRSDTVPPQAYFVDHAHMSEAGQRWFSPWVATELGRELERGR